MSKTLQNIKSFIDSLPARDIKLGNRFLENRNFNELKELVDSAIIRTKKNIRSEKITQEYLDVDLDRLNSLKAEVDRYIMQIEIPNLEENYYEGCENSFWPD